MIEAVTVCDRGCNRMWRTSSRRLLCTSLVRRSPRSRTRTLGAWRSPGWLPHCGDLGQSGLSKPPRKSTWVNGLVPVVPFHSAAHRAASTSWSLTLRRPPSKRDACSVLSRARGPGVGTGAAGPGDGTGRPSSTVSLLRRLASCGGGGGGGGGGGWPCSRVVPSSCGVSPSALR